jgi:hypothetical protein
MSFDHTATDPGDLDEYMKKQLKKVQNQEYQEYPPTLLVRIPVISSELALSIVRLTIEKKKIYEFVCDRRDPTTLDRNRERKESSMQI